MEKKYVAPEMEVYVVELESAILTGSTIPGGDNVEIGGSGEWE